MKITTFLLSLTLVSLFNSAWSQTDSTAYGTLIKRYYAAIEQHDYKTAYGYWQGNGEGSPKSLSAFANEFRQTAHTSVIVFKAMRQEAAAGSVYVTVPVEVKAELKTGKRQTFKGIYTLRRRNGPSSAKQIWHIYSAKLKPV